MVWCLYVSHFGKLLNSFSKWLHHFIFSPAMNKRFLSLQVLTYTSFCFFVLEPPHCGFDLHFPDMYRCWAPFYLLIGTSFCILSYLDKSPFKSFSILKLCYPSFCYWPEKVFHVFWVQLPYIWFHALIFSHSVDYLFYFLFF